MNPDPMPEFLRRNPDATREKVIAMIRHAQEHPPVSPNELRHYIEYKVGALSDSLWENFAEEVLGLCCI